MSSSLIKIIEKVCHLMLYVNNDFKQSLVIKQPIKTKNKINPNAPYQSLVFSLLGIRCRQCATLKWCSHFFVSLCEILSQKKNVTQTGLFVLLVYIQHGKFFIGAERNGNIQQVLQDHYQKKHDNYFNNELVQPVSLILIYFRQHIEVIGTTHVVDGETIMYILSQ